MPRDLFPHVPPPGRMPVDLMIHTRERDEAKGFPCSFAGIVAFLLVAMLVAMLAAGHV